jgi:signal peptidase I
MTVIEADSAPTEAPKKGGAAHETLEIIKTVLWALGIALVLRVLLFQPFTIPSASMEPTLFEGDYIIVSKWSYGYSRHSIPLSPPVMNGRVLERAPERGDIAVFKLPRDDRTDYIKRVVGLPGDRIQVRGGALYVNDRAVRREELTPDTETTPYGLTNRVPRVREIMPNGKAYITYDRQTTGEVDDTGVYVVPEGHYFMMGDNRDNSVDSRYPEEFGVGFVPAENLVGKAEFILLSWTPEAGLVKPWTWVTELRPSRFFTRLR